ncbi:RraA family protein [Ancylobacter sonchi]|uniref:RraA family protein n=1 Tax=Ancylobacter sonchi TaxID=1937790 RepID=UPI001BD2652B|nr:RraA family protein [Ancylobacter sonchi]MBS7535993.1 RraA family protein [Ancylobacter sonchi]
MAAPALPTGPDALVDAFADISVAVISDALDNLRLPNTLIDDVKPIVGRRVVGRAYTIERIILPVNATQAEIEPSLALGVQKAIDAARPGTVVVLASGGADRNSTWGGNMGLRAALLGVAGAVTDGPLRDIDEAEEIGLPVFGTGLNPRRSIGRLATVAIDVPVILNGVRIRPGDLIVGDRDGVIVVAPELAEAILAAAAGLREAEAAIQASVRDGVSLVDSISKFKKF